MTKERDHIGFDPIAWVDRLAIVNENSEFIEADKCTIRSELARLRERLDAERKHRLGVARFVRLSS